MYFRADIGHMSAWAWAWANVGAGLWTGIQVWIYTMLCIFIYVTNVVSDWTTINMKYDDNKTVL